MRSIPYPVKVVTFLLPLQLLLLNCLTSIPQAVAGNLKDYSLANNIVKNDKNITILEKNKPIDREIKSKEIHSYQVKLNAGEYLNIVAEQKNVDVEVILLGEAGKIIRKVDDYESSDSESMVMIADKSGVYNIEVRSRDNSGNYKIKIQELRSATELDKKIVQAAIFYAEAEELKIQSSANSLEAAIKKYEQALPLFREIGDRRKQATIFNNIATIYQNLGNRQRALELYNQALPIIRALGNKTEEAILLNNLAIVYQNLGENQKALEFYNQALLLWQSVGKASGEANTLLGMGRIYNILGDRPKALDYYNKALGLSRAINDKKTEASILSNIGGIYWVLGENNQALEYHNQALNIRQKIGDQSGESNSLINIGHIYSDFGDKQKALGYYNQALSITKKLGNKAGLATIFNSIGFVYWTMGDYQNAIDYYNQALPLRKAVGDRYGEAITINNIAVVYGNLGENKKAIEYYNQSLALSRAVGDKSGEAKTLNNIGLSYWNLGSNQKALEYYHQSLPIRKALGDRQGEAITSNNIGQLYSRLGNQQKAIEYYQQSLEILTLIKNRQLEATALNNIGQSYAILGDRKKALEYYNQALALRRQVSDRPGEATTLYTMAIFKKDEGNFPGAIADIEAAIKILEEVRIKINNQELRKSYFASVQDYYQFYIDLLMQLHKNNPSQGYDAKALQVSEKAKARSLLEMLTEAKTDIRSGVDAKLLEQEKKLQQQINIAADRLEKLANSKDQNSRNKIQKDLESLLSAYQQIQAEIRLKSPRYAALTQPQSLTVTEIQQNILDNNTLLLEYALGKQRSYLWVIGKNSIASYELPKGEKIEKAAKIFQTSLTAPTQRNRKQIVAEAAKNLSEMILKPAVDRLGNKRLLIVADGALQYIPFSALTLPGKSAKNSELLPLITNNEIITIPSASTLGILRRDLGDRKSAPKAIAVIADPVFNQKDERIKKNITNPLSNQLPIKISIMDQQLQRAANNAGIYWDRLPFTRTEAANILNLVPEKDRTQALDFNANLARINNPNLAEYRILHLATHGFVNTEKPELSGVILSLFDEKGNPQNGVLRLQDIYNLNLATDLVVLSACETGLGKDIKGEGLIGLTRGFMYAGAPRVVVSLWSVDDEATSQLMVKFYRGMLQNKLSPAAALRAAQIEMQKNSKWSSPYYWAAFTLQGEWR